MNQNPCPSLLSAMAGIYPRIALFMPVFFVATLAGVLHLWELLQSTWAVALVSFGCGVGFAFACLGSIALMPDRGKKPEIAQIPERQYVADSFIGRSVWQDIDGNRDLRHLLQERMRLRHNGKPRTVAESVFSAPRGPVTDPRGKLALVIGDDQTDE